MSDDSENRRTAWLIAGLPFSGREEYAEGRGGMRRACLTSFITTVNRMRARAALGDALLKNESEAELNECGREDTVPKNAADAVLVLGGSFGRACERKRLTELAHSYGYRVVCCFLRSHTDECAARAVLKSASAKALKQIMREAGQLDVPDYSEGCDRLFYVRWAAGGFECEDWLSGDEL